MDGEARLLLSEAIRMIREIHTKITALECVLEKRDPPLYKAYVRRLKRLESEGEQDNTETPFELPEGLSKKAMLEGSEE